MTIEVTFSDGHCEQIGTMFEWLTFLTETQDLETNFMASLTSDMYDKALEDLAKINSEISERISIIITVAKENGIEALVIS